MACESPSRVEREATKMQGLPAWSKSPWPDPGSAGVAPPSLTRARGGEQGVGRTRPDRRTHPQCPGLRGVGADPNRRKHKSAPTVFRILDTGSYTPDRPRAVSTRELRPKPRAVPVMQSRLGPKPRMPPRITRAAAEPKSRVTLGRGLEVFLMGPAAKLRSPAGSRDRAHWQAVPERQINLRWLRSLCQTADGNLITNACGEMDHPSA